MFLECWFTVNSRPIAKDALIAILPPGKISLDGKASCKLKTQAAVVLESEMEGVVLGIKREFDIFDDLAPDLREVHNSL